MSFKFECPQCGQPISAFPEDIGSSAFCPGCGTSLTVMQQQDVQYWLAIGNTKKGPYTESQIQEFWKSGSVSAETLCCKMGSSAWIPVSKAFAAPQPGLRVQNITGQTQRPRQQRSFFQSPMVIGYAILLAVIISIVVGASGGSFGNSSSSTSATSSSAVSRPASSSISTVIQPSGSSISRRDLVIREYQEKSKRIQEHEEQALRSIIYEEVKKAYPYFSSPEIAEEVQKQFKVRLNGSEAQHLIRMAEIIGMQTHWPVLSEEYKEYMKH